MYAATSVQLDLPPGPENHACILVGPLDLQLGMFPVGCVGWISPTTQLKGEVDIDWLVYYAASQACVNPGDQDIGFPRDEGCDEMECLICMDGSAIFSWAACNHNRALLCLDCTERTEKQATTLASKCVLCRQVSDLVPFQI